MKYAKKQRVTPDEAITFSVNPCCTVVISPFVRFVYFAVPIVFSRFTPSCARFNGNFQVYGL
jgi:hypothetical protein